MATSSGSTRVTAFFTPWAHSRVRHEDDLHTSDRGQGQCCHLAVDHNDLDLVADGTCWQWQRSELHVQVVVAVCSSYNDVAVYANLEDIYIGPSIIISMFIYTLNKIMS